MGSSLRRVETKLFFSFIALGLASLCYSGLVDWDANAQTRGDRRGVQPDVVRPSGIEAQGDLDLTFDVDGYNSVFFGADSNERFENAYGIGIQNLGANAGKVVLGGDTLKSSATAVYDLALTRFHVNGTLDTTFGTNGKVTVDFGTNGIDTMQSFVGTRAIAVDQSADGVEGDKIVIVGHTDASAAVCGTGSDLAIAKFLPNGTPDVTFNAAGLSPGELVLDVAVGCRDLPSAVIIQPADHKIVITSWGLTAGGSQLQIVRLNSVGTVDSSFGGGDGILTIPVATDTIGLPNDIQLITSGTHAGKYIITGAATVTALGSQFMVARINANGTLDTTFGPADTGYVTANFNPNLANEVAYSVAINSDASKIVVGGYEGLDGGNTDNFALMRFDTDGTLDTTFGGDGKVSTNVAGGINQFDYVNTVHMMSDGRIVATGRNGIGGIAIVRYDATGANDTDILDTTFSGDGIVTSSLAAGANPQPKTGILQGNGKILVAGGLTNAGVTNPDFFAARFINLTQTASDVSVSGRVFAPGGRGLTNARVTITAPNGSSRTVITGRGGSFHFERVESGQTYIVSVGSQRYAYEPQAISVNESVAGLSFYPE